MRRLFALHASEAQLEPPRFNSSFFTAAAHSATWPRCEGPAKSCCFFRPTVHLLPFRLLHPGDMVTAAIISPPAPPHAANGTRRPPQLENSGGRLVSSSSSSTGTSILQSDSCDDGFPLALPGLKIVERGGARVGGGHTWSRAPSSAGNGASLAGRKGPRWVSRAEEPQP